MPESQPAEEGGCLYFLGSIILMLLAMLFVNLTILRAESNCEMLGELFEVKTETRWVMFCQYQEDGVWRDLTLENLRDG